MKLWIGNIAPGTSDDDVKALVSKYAPTLECTEIQRVDGDGSRPAAWLSYPAAPLGALETVSMRLHGMFWKGRELVVQTTSR
ncbi:MAG TPA: RNA-binding protein [Burkholderiales bacterium]|nr:RNA-binding protein [Burkholderiales bacterium]